MTKEGYNKHKELIEAWLDGKQIQILGENGQWIDSLADIKWKEHKEYRVKPTKIEFEDCSFNDEEYCVDEFGRISEIEAASFNIEKRTNFIKDKKIAEAYAVLPKLIRLMDEYNEGWKPDWEERYNKYCIGLHQNIISQHSLAYINEILAFKTAEIRDRFLEDHRELIEIAKPLL